jgi:hypothetical protein
MNSTYAHASQKLNFRLSVNNRVSISKKSFDRTNYLLRVCLFAHELANLIGIRSDYSTRECIFEPLTISLPVLSAQTHSDLRLLKGWGYFQSCVKGFNSLGLIAEQLLPVYDSYLKRPLLVERDLKVFLESRVLYSDVLRNHPDIASYAQRLNHHTTDAHNLICLSVWKAFAKRPIICSTSSNMGISLHESLRAFQSKPISINDRKFSLLSPDEGCLVIWCPDREADFMNGEKSDMLESLTTEYTQTTKLRTYINRQQRDPGALSDALFSGGYFFPTNPQSTEELQNLLFVGLKELANKKSCEISDLLAETNVQSLLESLEAEVCDKTVVVSRGIEGGIGGLMIPYFIMLEESLRFSRGKSVKYPSTWNQASIGAALAATVIADNILRGYSRISDFNQELLHRRFLYISNNIRGARTICSRSRIHGLFDLANIQSLAQLLGVVVLRHTSGRGTAFVGLGSSSYSNGNLCFEILNESSTNHLAFRGKDTFHPATHTLNFIAQAIIYGEGQRLIKQGFLSYYNEYAKPEPAGAAALAGYLLFLLDNQFLSIYEIAFVLRRLGYTEDIFLKFCNFPPSEEGKSSFVQLAFEEGPCMGNFASNLLTLLSLELETLKRESCTEAQVSRRKRDSTDIIDRLGFSKLYVNYIYSTGNNTLQPSEEIQQLLRANSFEEVQTEDDVKYGLLKRIMSQLTRSLS